MINKCVRFCCKFAYFQWFDGLMQLINYINVLSVRTMFVVNNVYVIKPFSLFFFCPELQLRFSSSDYCDVLNLSLIHI